MMIDVDIVGNDNDGDDYDSCNDNDNYFDYDDVVGVGEVDVEIDNYHQRMMSIGMKQSVLTLPTYYRNMRISSIVHKRRIMPIDKIMESNSMYQV